MMHEKTIPGFPGMVVDPNCLSGQPRLVGHRIALSHLIGLIVEETESLLEAEFHFSTDEIDNIQRYLLRIVEDWEEKHWAKEESCPSKD